MATTRALDQDERTRVLADNAEAYARVALANIEREFPASAPYYVTEPGPLPLPRERHPAFYGSLDWHSCVEMHWVLVRLLRLFPELALGARIRAVLDEHLTRENLELEAEYFVLHRGFERPYGWGWCLRLAHEIATWDDPDGARWSANLATLAEVLRQGFVTWLPNATYPQRTGLHGNTAFALLLALDYALREDGAGEPDLVRTIHGATLRWYGQDRGYAAQFEPSGSDFLSPALTEAALMARVIGKTAFVPWFDAFLPSLDALLTPAAVSDPTDGQIAHLHGLNLSRAYCMRVISEALPHDDVRVPALSRAIAAHADASLSQVVGSDYMVEHWLAAYALLLLS